MKENTKSERIVADVKPDVKKKLRILAAHEGVALQVVMERLIVTDYNLLMGITESEESE